MNPYVSMHFLDDEEYKRYKVLTPFSQPAAATAVQLSEDAAAALRCDVCDRKGFAHENVLAHHMKSHRPGHACNVCEERLPTKRALKQHLREHRRHPAIAINETAVETKCPTCDKIVANKRALTRHIHLAHNKKPNRLLEGVTNWLTIQHG